jgi:hypothetical protein
VQSELIAAVAQDVLCHCVEGKDATEAKDGFLSTSTRQFLNDVNSFVPEQPAKPGGEQTMIHSRLMHALTRSTAKVCFSRLDAVGQEVCDQVNEKKPGEHKNDAPRPVEVVHAIAIHWYVAENAAQAWAYVFYRQVGTQEVVNLVAYKPGRKGVPKPEPKLAKL